MCASFFSRDRSHPHAHPVVALLTDFGLTDAYVGIIKGVILTRCPAARIIDVTHGIAPGNIPGAAYVLSTAIDYFPPGAVFTIVVDPGVGSRRRILAASARGGRFFVAPDNGILSAALDESPPDQIVSVTNHAHFLHPVSQTFHGRDIFAPVAAAIASGVRLDDLGPTIHEWFHIPRLEPVDEAGGKRTGQVIHIDHFGNLITSFRAGDLDGQTCVIIGSRRIDRLSRHYAEVDAGRLLALIGSSGRLEISVHGGSAAEMLNAAVGTEVRVQSRQ